ncbi:MAG: CcmD family protein [Bacillota bacterium]|jgi:CcmD family protein
MRYLFWAYTITWILLFGYTLSIGIRQHKINNELQWLKKLIDEKNEKGQFNNHP